MFDLNTFKDIIYPISDLTIKILIGIVIVVYLHRRSYQDKIKETLIHTYMEFLGKIENFSYYQINEYETKFYEKLKDWAKHNLSNKEILSKFSKELETIFQQKQSLYSDDYFQKNANISPYTYKYCFLIGKKYYFKKSLTLENKMAQFLLNNERSTQIADVIIKSRPVQALLSDLNIENILEILSNIKKESVKQIIQKHQEDNLKFLNPYGTKVAEAIDRL